MSAEMRVRDLINALQHWSLDASVYLTGDYPVLWVRDPAPKALMNHEDVLPSPFPRGQVRELIAAWHPGWAEEVQDDLVDDIAALWPVSSEPSVTERSRLKIARLMADGPLTDE